MGKVDSLGEKILEDHPDDPGMQSVTAKIARSHSSKPSSFDFTFLEAPRGRVQNNLHNIFSYILF